MSRDGQALDLASTAAGVLDREVGGLVAEVQEASRRTRGPQDAPLKDCFMELDIRALTNRTLPNSKTYPDMCFSVSHGSAAVLMRRFFSLHFDKFLTKPNRDLLARGGSYKVGAVEPSAIWLLLPPSQVGSWY